MVPQWALLRGGTVLPSPIGLSLGLTLAPPLQTIRVHPLETDTLINKINSPLVFCLTCAEENPATLFEQTMKSLKANLSLLL